MYNYPINSDFHLISMKIRTKTRVKDDSDDDQWRIHPSVVV